MEPRSGRHLRNRVGERPSEGCQGHARRTDSGGDRGPSRARVPARGGTGVAEACGKRPPTVKGSETSGWAGDQVLLQFTRPAAPPRPRWGIGTVHRRDTCFLNIVGRCRQPCLAAQKQRGTLNLRPRKRCSERRRERRPKSALTAWRCSWRGLASRPSPQRRLPPSLADAGTRRRASDSVPRPP
jgi:hypothetical protein